MSQDLYSAHTCTTCTPKALQLTLLHPPTTPAPNTLLLLLLLILNLT